MATPEAQAPEEPGTVVPPATLQRKLVKIMELAPFVEKKGKNAHFGYKFARAQDVATLVRGALIEQGVLMWSSLKSLERTGQFTVVVMHYTVQDADSGDKIEFDMPGCGQDPGDKGPAKAITMAGKYAMTELLRIATTDDPEADAGTDRAAKERKPAEKKEPPALTSDNLRPEDRALVLRNLLGPDPKRRALLLKQFSCETMEDLVADDAQYAKAKALVEKNNTFLKQQAANADS